MSQAVQIVKLTDSDAERLWHFALIGSAIGTGCVQRIRRRTSSNFARQIRFAPRVLPVRTTSFWEPWTDPELVGIAGFWRDKKVKEQHKGHIWGVFVVPSHRERGMGRALIGEILHRARLLPDFVEVQLTVATQRAEARNLYSQLWNRAAIAEGERTVYRRGVHGLISGANLTGVPEIRLIRGHCLRKNSAIRTASNRLGSR
jgi:ribosomal protein S18 acetylase RimI-like enzyme